LSSTRSRSGSGKHFRPNPGKPNLDLIPTLSLGMPLPTFRRAGEEPILSNPAFFFRAAGWIVLNMVLIVAGAFIGGMLTPKVNPHNDWGATGMMYALGGALVGTSTTIVLLLWRSARRTKPGPSERDL